jgi:hypothetical protein
MSNETELTRMADELIALRQDNIGLRLALKAKQDSIDGWVKEAVTWRHAWEDLHQRVRGLAANYAEVAALRQEMKIKEEETDLAVLERNQWTS